MALNERSTRPYRQVSRAGSTQELRNGILLAFRKLARTTWMDDLTLDDVAKEAHTTRQTVIRMFGSKIGLLMESMPGIHDEIVALQRFGRGSTLEEIAVGTIADLEVLGEMRMSILALAPRHPELEPALDVGRKQQRKNMRNALAPWLDTLPPDEAERRLVECLITTDTYTWAILRRDMKKTVPEAQRIIADMLRRILEGPRPTAKKKDKK